MAPSNFLADTLYHPFDEKMTKSEQDRFEMTKTYFSGDLRTAQSSPNFIAGMT